MNSNIEKEIKGGAITHDDNIAHELIPNDVSECALITGKGNGDICVSDEAIKALKVVAKTNDKDPKKVMEAAKKKLGCETQRCVLKSNEFKNVVGVHAADREIKENLKINGPTSTALLSNINIDATLRQWGKKFKDFYPYNFNMVDYEERGDTLATVDVKDLYDRGYRTFACVINSDTYKGKGEHWMALFGDMRSDNKWTVEFFNSSGRAPVHEFAKWLTKTKNRFDDIIREYNLGAIAESVKVAKIQHQKTRTECGVYSLYYIWARLHGTPYTYFLDTEISDALCFEFRQHLFYDPARKPVKRFNYKEFEGSANIKWERNVPKAVIDKMREIASKFGGGTITTVNFSKPDVMSIVFRTAKEWAEYDVPVDFSLFLRADNRALDYRRRENDLKLTLHWGQRKLLLAEIYFLSKYAAETVVYAGAAPGDHIPALAKMFPGRQFILYDPREFSAKILAGIKNIAVNRAEFTNEDAQKYQGKNVLFISDIRTSDSSDGKIAEDMELQKQWHEIINPAASLLKFRLPYASGKKIQYLRGDILIQPWAPHTSTETRLIVPKSNYMMSCEYDARLYERQMFRHNLITRAWQPFDHDIKGEGIDHCWDCRAEIEILGEYLRATRSSRSISELSRQISRQLSPKLTLIHPPHGIYVCCPMEKKIDKIYAKYYKLIDLDHKRRKEWKKMQKTTHIYVMRHAQTDYNVDNIIQGAPGSGHDPPINETGKNQAKKTAKKLANVKFAAVYSSPSLRTTQTAKIVAGKLPKIIEGLKDRDLFAFAGYDHDEYKDLPNFSEDKVESVTDYALRVTAEITQLAAKHITGNILIVTHGCASVFKNMIEDNIDAEPELLNNAAYFHVILHGDDPNILENYEIVEWNVSP